MTSFNRVKLEVFNNVQRHAYYDNNIAGLSAHERHTKYVNDYLKFYGKNSSTEAQPKCLTLKSDKDILRETYRFIRTEQDDANNTWEARLAKRYYDRLFKEYCIADLSRYKENKLGLRWRAQKEVLSGKGQFSCGAKGCDETRGLCSYEVNFSYIEPDGQKQALIKLRVCPSCAYKLNYKKEKQYMKAERGKKRLRLAEDPLAASIAANALIKEHEISGLVPLAAAQLKDRVPEVAQLDATANASSLPADESVWEQKPVQDTSLDEDFEEYFDGMFL